MRVLKERKEREEIADTYTRRYNEIGVILGILLLTLHPHPTNGCMRSHLHLQDVETFGRTQNTVWCRVHRDVRDVPTRI